MRARALILLAYLLAAFALGYAASEWSWWLLLALPVLLFSYGWAIAWSYDRGRPETVDGRVVDRELY